MDITTWKTTLTSAGRPLDTAELRTGAERIAVRAQALMNNRATFHVSVTSSGVRISADPPSLLARRALDRAVDAEIASIKAAMGAQGRERLTVG